MIVKFILNLILIFLKILKNNVFLVNPVPDPRFLLHLVLLYTLVVISKFLNLAHAFLKNMLIIYYQNS